VRVVESTSGAESAKTSLSPAGNQGTPIAASSRDQRKTEAAFRMFISTVIAYHDHIYTRASKPQLFGGSIGRKLPTINEGLYHV
jgi:hypothetical protein